MGILEKRSAELSAEDFEHIEKPLGKRVPYPMLGLGRSVDSQGGTVVSRYLGTLERPLTICSERSLDEVEGILLRDMPTPEMLPLFYDVMSAMHPRNMRRAMFVEGAPGAGKTFLGDLAGRVASRQGAIKIDCTGLNLNELFYETVLDFKGGKRFYDALDEKIAKYNEHIKDQAIRDSVLNPMSVNILRDCMGEAFTEEKDGRISIDWGGVKKSHKGPDGFTYLSSRECTEIAMNGLLQVSKKEGLDLTGGNALGMATQEGVAWQAYKEGRVLILDELNRAKPGTFGKLHGWLQFVIGETPEYVASNPLKEKGDKAAQNLRFTRDGMTAGHFVFMTGNSLDDSNEVQELPEALSSRIVPRHVPKATPQGWQHRFCQMLTGLPISTIYEANRDVWEKDPLSFERSLRRWRAQGESRVVPADQQNMLRRWQDVMLATEHLAKFLDSASKVVNPDSDWHRKTTSLAQLMEEISESYKKEISIDFRKITYFLNLAGQDKPAVRKPGGGSEVVPFISLEDMPETPEELKDKLGTYLTYAIVDWIVSNTFDRGKDGLGRQLLQLAQDCALIRPALKDAKQSNRKTVAELLDYNPYQSERPDVQAEVVRKLMCRDLRERYPDIRAEDDDLMSVLMVQNALETMKTRNRGIARDNEGVNNNVIVFNGDPDRIYAQPLCYAAVFDRAAGQDAAAADLVSGRAFLYALAAPALRQENLRALWTRGLSGGMRHGIADGNAPADPAVAIAEARTGSNIGVTTIMVGGDRAKAEPLHVVWNKHSGALLVVGDSDIAPDLRKIFNRTQVSYISRNELDAPVKTAKALQRVLGAEGAEAGEGYIKRAFLLRATSGFLDRDEAATLSDLLVRRDVKPFLPVYLVDTAKPADMMMPKAA